MKLKVGKDEYCSNCMEWREYSEDGRCIVCNKIIKKKVLNSHIKSYDDYKQDDFERDADTEFEDDIE